MFEIFLNKCITSTSHLPIPLAMAQYKYCHYHAHIYKNYDMPTIKTKYEIPAIEPVDSQSDNIHVFDYYCLRNGDYIVALGDLGVKFYSKDNSIIRHFKIPAHSLVFEEFGHRVIAVEVTDSTHIVSQINLKGLKSKPWFETKLTTWAFSFDEPCWHISIGNRVLGIDVDSEGFKICRELKQPNGNPYDLSGDIVSMAHDLSGGALLIEKNDKSYEFWSLGLMQIKDENLILRRSSRSIENLHFSNDFYNITPSGFMVSLSAMEQSPSNKLEANLVFEDPYNEGHFKKQILLKSGNIKKLISTDRFSVITVETTSGYYCYLIQHILGEIMAEIFIPDSGKVYPHLTESNIFIGDNMGRIINYDLETGVCESHRL